MAHACAASHSFRSATLKQIEKNKFGMWCWKIIFMCAEIEVSVYKAAVFNTHMESFNLNLNMTQIVRHRSDYGNICDFT